ncbi:MAG: sodium-dependent transporter [Deltaproteobacteria bacterium]|nr:sodium-dependent transporter [Deltaproteobacteria bacterium]
MPQASLTTSGWITLVATWSIIGGLTIWCFGRVLCSKKGPGGTAGRARWASRVGLILAVSGNAIGLGNFLRFPVKVASNGGGAFLVPYFCAFLFLGIPLMWVEWTTGRLGGSKGHGSTPGMFSLLWKHPASKYLGALGIALPFGVAVFYCFIESWTLAFATFSATGLYFGNTTREAMGAFLRGYQGVESNASFGTVLPAVGFLLLTLLVNWWFLRRGLARGIEILARYGMPILFLCAVVLVIRVLTFGSPDPTQPENSVARGMAWLWNPDFSRLDEAKVWLIAAGQVFFTLSLGQGMINTYASYVGEDQDITLNGLTTAMTNEFAEVILGATLAIPAAVAFFGLAETQAIAQGGAFDLGFQSLPVIFQQVYAGQAFGTLWFGLLFIAGITSSVAMIQPVVAFLEDELKIRRKRAVDLTFLVLVACTTPVVAFFKFGFLDEMDFWIGTFGLALFAVLEIGVFSWIYGVDRGWKEMHRGADLEVPRVFRFILRWVTPLYLVALLVVWTWQDAIPELMLRGREPAEVPYHWAARLLCLAILAGALLLVRIAWRRRARLAYPSDSAACAAASRAMGTRKGEQDT